MDIRSVDGHALSSPIDPPQDRQFHGGKRTLHKRDVVLVVVETADGTRGVATGGASSSAMREFFEDESKNTFADVLEGPVAELLEGHEIDSITDVHELLDQTDIPEPLVTKVISAIDVALYDILGKQQGMPVYELLYEQYEDAPDPTTNLPLYASSGMYMDPRGFAEQAGYVDEAGFFGYKYRPGIGPEADKRTIDLVSDAVDDTEVMLDAHTWWKLQDTYGEDVIEDIVTYAADNGAYWVEEPVEPDDYDGYRRLASTGAPLAGGESELSPEGLVELGRTDAVDFLQGDVRHHRGFTGCYDAIEFCRGRDIEFVPHNFGTWIGLMANAHLVAAGPEVELVEYPLFEGDPVIDTSGDPGMYPFDLAFDLVKGQPPVEDGRLTVPDEPGLGIEVDLDVVDEYPFIDGPWTTFDYDD